MLKKIISVVIALTMIMTAASLCACASSPAQSEIGERTTMEIVEDMGVGINLGNTFDSTGDWFHDVPGQETAWGSPIITKKIIQGYADAGFGVMRLPVSWTVLMDKDGSINADFIDRVEEVAGWILDSGMYCILNSHHDGWSEKFYDDEAAAMELYEKMWKQICERFKDYGEKLMFESMNEVGFDKLWNRYGGTQGKAEAFDMFNKINQKFVDIVRASGGNNGERHLLIAAYWTDINLACDEMFKMPDDPEGRCAVSVHYYTPATFCILSEDADWGKARTDWGSEADYNELNTQFDMMKEHYIDKGIPVIVGEFGCATSNKSREVAELWLNSVTEAALSGKLCPVLWDTPGGEYDREKAEFKYPDFMKNLTALNDKY
mgnify:FL=1